LDRNGFKSSESGFDANETNPFLSISIHFRLLSYNHSFYYRVIIQQSDCLTKI